MSVLEIDPLLAFVKTIYRVVKVQGQRGDMILSEAATGLRFK